jgi:predicted nucleic acid-binding protein
VRLLLDSTLLIDHANGDQAAIATLRRLYEEGHELFTCDVVTCEVLSRGTASEVRHLHALLDALDYAASTPDAAQWAGESRRRRHASGRKRSLADAIIAGVATSLAATVVTRNRPDFERQGVPVMSY